jgi:hypothetical protein
MIKEEVRRRFLLALLWVIMTVVGVVLLTNGIYLALILYHHSR